MKKLEEKNYNEGPEEEMVLGLRDSINIEQEEVQKEEEETKEKTEEEGIGEEASSETEEDKSINDVNYWKKEIIPNDNIMSAILNYFDWHLNLLVNLEESENTELPFLNKDILKKEDEIQPLLNEDNL